MTAFLRPADYFLFALLVLGLPLRAWLAMRRLRNATDEEAAELRPMLWWRAIGTQWLLTAAVVLQWIVQRRSFESLWLVPTIGWGAGGVLLGLALAAIMLQPQRRNLAGSPETVARLRERLAGVKRLLPASRDEWPGFVPLAITAGICEEVLFRGFVLWALAQVMPAWWMAALAQAVLFGLAHAYQGARGIVATFAVGAFLAGVVWVSGSLWPAMLVHALLDLNAGDLAIRVAALPEPDEARGT
jgi:membrane protease YdiL (CAAX protease family)